MTETSGASSPPPVADTETLVTRQLSLAKSASRRLARLAPGAKAEAIRAMADGFEEATPRVLEANRADFEEGQARGLRPALLDRLHLDRKGLGAMVASLRRIAELPDPVGVIEEVSRQDSGIEVARVRAPLGVVAVLYQSRLHLSTDAAAVSLKAGNAVVLPIGREAPQTARIIADVLNEAGMAAGLPLGFLVTLETDDPETLAILMTSDELLDLVICRGSQDYSRQVVQGSTVPVIWHGPGFCHVYVEQSADLEEAGRILLNSKLGRTASTNSAKSLLVDREVAASFLAGPCRELAEAGIELKADAEAAAILAAEGIEHEAVDAGDLGRYLGDLKLAVQVIEHAGAAIEVVNRTGTGHSEVICTRDFAAARRFQDEVDAACVYVNASSRFTDGTELGLGVDLAVATTKLPCRGPVTARTLTCTKYLVSGTGQIRPGRLTQ